MIQEAILKLCESENLTYEEAAGCIDEIMGGNTSQAQTAAFLMGLAAKGETVEEIAACAEFDAKIAAVQEKAAKLAERKKEVLSPKKRKPRKSKAERIRELVKQAQKSGMKLDEIAEKLGMPLSE